MAVSGKFIYGKKTYLKAKEKEKMPDKKPKKEDKKKPAKKETQIATCGTYGTIYPL